MADAFQYDVFLSHSTKDKTIVCDVAERLRKDGLKVWFDEWVLKPGDSIPAKIEEGLEHSRVLVLCMSAHAFGSDWAQLACPAVALPRRGKVGTFRFRDPLNKERRFMSKRTHLSSPNLAAGTPGSPNHCSSHKPEHYWMKKRYNDLTLWNFKKKVMCF